MSLPILSGRRNGPVCDLDPVPVVALAGAPNSGKSTLFNALTGASVAMGNWPGTSVERTQGVWQLGADEPGSRPVAAACVLIDLPGAYSLDPLTSEEKVTADILRADDPPDAVVLMADAAHLARSLYLLAQMREQSLRVIVALAMVDVAADRGKTVDVEALRASLGVLVVPLDPRRRRGLDDLAAAARTALAGPAPPPRPVATASSEAALALEDDRFAWIEQATTAATTEAGERRASWGERLDHWVLAPVTGPLIFLAAMWAILQITTTAVTPLQRLLEGFLTGTVAGWARAGLARSPLGGSWLDGLLVDGLITGVGMVLSFVPLMTVMFGLLALLEDSGYLARAAVVADATMRRLGLPGQAFLPLIVGFGCNVPAVAATRVLPRREQRLLTVLLVPFTSCTARLTVYLLIGSVFFGHWAGTAVFCMYLVSVLLVVGVGMVLKRVLWGTLGDQAMVLDLPAYQRPTWAITWTVTWQRLRDFLQTAGGIIVAAVLVVWLLEAIPAGRGSFGQVELGDSVLAWLTKAVTPVFTWAGFADWRLVAGLLVGLVAKEAVVSTWAQTFLAVDPATAGTDLGESLQAVFAQASGGHETAAVIAILVFILAYTPCVATLASQAREIGGRWTAFSVALQLVVAWGLASLVFQVGVLLS